MAGMRQPQPPTGGFPGAGSMAKQPQNPMFERLGLQMPQNPDMSEAYARAAWERAGQPFDNFYRYQDYMNRLRDKQFLRGGNAGPMGSRSMRGPTTPWGSGGGGDDAQLMALLQQLGVGG